MPPSVAESVAARGGATRPDATREFRCEAHAPARTRALCTSPLLRFVSCPLSLLSPAARIARCTLPLSRSTSLILSSSRLSLFPSTPRPLLFSFTSAIPVSPLLLRRSRLRSSGRRSPVGADTLALPLPDQPFPPPRGTFQPPLRRAAVARSGRWPRDHVVCISHTLLTYICMHSRLCAPRATMHSRARSFRGK